jgi:hypothetical protein
VIAVGVKFSPGENAIGRVAKPLRAHPGGALALRTRGLRACRFRRAGPSHPWASMGWEVVRRACVPSWRCEPGARCAPVSPPGHRGHEEGKDVRAQCGRVNEVRVAASVWTMSWRFSKGQRERSALP